MKGSLAIAGDADADRLLNTDPLALLLGMLLDQQIPMEWAFMGPYRLTDRLDAPLDAATIAAMDPDEFAELVRAKPALHRFPGSMATRMQALCQHLVDEYDGDAGAVWRGVRRGDVLLERLVALPGYGEEKARIFIAILAKRFGKTPAGWEDAAGPFADDTPRSVADIDSRRRPRPGTGLEEAAEGQGQDQGRVTVGGADPAARSPFSRHARGRAGDACRSWRRRRRRGRPRPPGHRRRCARSRGRGRRR